MRSWLLCATLAVASLALLTVSCAPRSPEIAPASAEVLPALVDLFTPRQIDEAVAAGLPRQIALLQESSSEASAAALDGATADLVLPVWPAGSDSTQAALWDYLGKNPERYEVSVFLDGDPVGEYSLDVLDGRIGEGIYTSGAPWTAARLDAIDELRSALGPDAEIAYAGGGGASAMVGWSPKGQGLVFIGLIHAYAENMLVQPDLGRLYTGDDALEYAAGFWVNPAP